MKLEIFANELRLGQNRKSERSVSGMIEARPSAENARFAAKYAKIDDIGERAFNILADLGMDGNS